MVEAKCILLKNYFRDTNMPVASSVEGGIMNYLLVPVLRAQRTLTVIACQHPVIFYAVFI